MIRVCYYDFLPTLLIRDFHSVHGVYASFPFGTASGHIKCTGNNPPAYAGKKYSFYHGLYGVSLNKTGSLFRKTAH